MNADEKVVETHEETETVLNTKTGERRKRKRFKDVDISHEGTKILLPSDMEIPQAVEWLLKKQAAEEELYVPNIVIDRFPFDALVAFEAAIRQVAGFAKYEPTFSFFGKNPPQIISIPVSPTETIECPVGKMTVPGIEGYLLVEPSVDRGKPCLVITGEIKKKCIAKLKEIARITKELVQKQSIYQGKAIILGVRKELRGKKETAKDAAGRPPAFMVISQLTEKDLILDSLTQQMVDSLLWTPIEKLKVIKKYKVPTKRGVLLEGPYGTGKSLAANITMTKAVNNGWTFICLEDSDLLTMAIDMASWYQPAVIFCEDIDQIMSGADRTNQMDTILNMVDGIEKEKQILIVLTTNHVERLNAAFLRPGRLDAIIRFQPPDPETAERLLRKYATQDDGTCLIPDNEDITQAGQLLAGAPASMVQEVVERSKLSAICRVGHAKALSSLDLSVSAKALQNHLELMRGEKPNPGDPKLFEAGKSLGHGFATGMQAWTEVTARVSERLPRLGKEIARISSKPNGDEGEEEVQKTD